MKSAHPNLVVLCTCVTVCVCECLYKEGVADRMLCVSSLQHPLCCHGETVLCFPIGGEINTIFNWPGGLPPVWESEFCCTRTATRTRSRVHTQCL